MITLQVENLQEARRKWYDGAEFEFTRPQLNPARPDRIVKVTCRTAADDGIRTIRLVDPAGRTLNVRGQDPENTPWTEGRRKNEYSFLKGTRRTCIVRRTNSKVTPKAGHAPATKIRKIKVRKED